MPPANEPSEPLRHEQWFVTTHWSIVLEASDGFPADAQKALQSLCGTCWYPLYTYVRRRGYDAHTAQDLTQGFFAHLLEKNQLARANLFGVADYSFDYTAPPGEWVHLTFVGTSFGTTLYVNVSMAATRTSCRCPYGCRGNNSAELQITGSTDCSMKSPFSVEILGQRRSLKSTRKPLNEPIARIWREYFACQLG